MDRLTSISSVGRLPPSLPASPGKCDYQTPADEFRNDNSSEASKRVSLVTGDLPPEAVLLILQNLPLATLITAQRVSHRMRDLCRDVIASKHNITLRKPEHIETVVKAFGEKPYLRITLKGRLFTKADLEKLPRSLKSLSLCNCSGLKVDGLMQVIALTELEELTLIHTPHVTDLLCQQIGQLLKKLRYLNLDLCEDLSEKVTAKGLRYITQSKGLEELTLHAGIFTDEVLKQIGQLSKLRCLTLNRGRVTADGLVSMLEKLVHLKKLVLIPLGTIIYRSQGPHRIFDQLDPLQKLERLIVDDDNEFTDEHRAFIQEKLKTMQISITKPLLKVAVQE